MNTARTQNRNRWAKEFEESLERAIEAEAGGRYESAEWLFQRALFFEAKLEKVSDPRAYLDSAGPVYGEARN
jgi:hypothetical protein